MHVELLVTEAVRVAAARELEDLGADDVAIEGIGTGRIGRGDDGMVEAQPKLRYRIASRSASVSRWKTSRSMRAFSARLGIRWRSASSYVGSSAW